MRFRLTLRRDPPHAMDLRGYFDSTIEEVEEMAAVLKKLDIFVIASLANDDYDPFQEPQ